MNDLLVVDDEPDWLALVKLFLGQMGEFRVDTRTSATDGLAALGQHQYDAVISDYEMPGMNGIEFLRAVRSGFGRIPFIVLTGKGREEVVIDALNNGADYYLQKGGDPRALFAELAHVVGRSIQLKNAGETLYEREQRYHDLQNANDLIQSVAPDGHFIYVNNRWLETLGYREQDVADLNVFDIVHPDSLPHCREIFQRLISGENVGIIEVVFKTSEGRRVFVEGMATCRMNGGAPQSTRGVYTDVTRRKVAEQKLAEAEEFNRRIVESCQECIKVLDLDGNLLSMNSYGQQQIGVTDITPYIGTSFLHFWQEVSPEKVSETLEAARQNRRGQFEALCTAVTGESKYWDVVITPICDARGIPERLLATSRDIDERKRAEEVLRRSERELKVLLDSLPTGVVIVDAATHLITDANATALALFDAPRGMVIGRHCHNYICPATEGDCPITDHGNTIDRSERIAVTAHGEEIPVLKSVAKMHLSGRECLVESFMDISDRKRAEEALMRANRQLNMMASITRHDILNKVTVLLGYIALLREQVSGPGVAQYLDILESTTNIIRSQIEFSRNYQEIGAQEPRWLLVSDLLPYLHLPPGVRMLTDLSGVEILADPLLEKVFFNLLDNSVRHGGSVTSIRVYSTGGPDDTKIVWEDNGTGIPDEEKERIFRRGYGKNTGFGLFLVREVLSITGMTITETGSSGTGARFEICVPPEKVRIRGPAAPSPSAGTGDR